MSNSMIYSPDTDQARFEGYQAARRGECYRSCPHPYRTPLRTAWLEGYRSWLDGRRMVNPSAPRADFKTGVAA
ncbi:Rmf/CrpP family protein [Hyphomicrobium sp. CS1GBMeth3]|uniref:ribosome modulation factor n=1 Tax=Hyphomicrobium sp. CS1GBMeth3 TaxID=1892845 RepID=UPI000B0E3149|nr:Rmf/CrpP family protein [Hyphomicrobium sp. CS1GBMeth3]